MMPKINATLTILLFLAAAPLFPSQTRVDSTGGLSLVLDDETASLNPFVLGDPAGLALIPSQSRLDYSWDWLKIAAPISAFQAHLYGSTAELGSDTVNYHGLIWFPAKEWAIQLDGDFLNNEGDVLNSVFPTQSEDRTRGTFRTAARLGPIVLGAQVQSSQSNLALNLPTFSGGTVNSQTGNRSNLNAQGGLLVSLLSPDPGKDQLEIGGVFASQVTQGQEIDQLQVTIFPSTQANLTNTITDNAVQEWGPEIYFNSPGSFQAEMMARFVTVGLSTQMDSSNSSLAQPLATLENANETLVAGGFKAKMPMGNSTSLNSGLIFSYDNSTSNVNSTYISGNGGTGSRDQWQLTAGSGVEKTGEFTAGLQGEIQGATGNGLSGGITTGTVDYFAYKVSAGGEKWLSPQWAFRAGMVFLDEINTGTQDYQANYYAIGADSRLVTTTLNVGTGYQDKQLKADFRFWYGYIYDYNASDAYGTFIGLNAAAGILF